ncbi:hypothetical protein [Lamprocystis purpurea]|jgi:hypothetical protein|uniref:hypothetical protein n=1 Tax=Lamprocystis purpurea TaxID=61598 RepID=UPI0003713386|nr:hypothetical protein [Lamprocystis purpurea]
MAGLRRQLGVSEGHLAEEPQRRQLGLLSQALVKDLNCRQLQPPATLPAPA